MPLISVYNYLIKTKVIITVRHLTCLLIMLIAMECSFNLASDSVCPHQVRRRRHHDSNPFGKLPEGELSSWAACAGITFNTESGCSEAKTADGWLIDHFSFSQCPLLTYGIGSLGDNVIGASGPGS